LPYRPW